MNSKKKLIISMLVVSFVLLSIIATVAIAFALTQQTIKTTLNIGYTVEDIDGTASATFTVGGVTENLTAMKGTQVIGDTLVFKASDTEDAGNLMFPEDALALTAQNDNVVIQYTYSNTGAKHYIASMDFAANIEADNMKVEYSINGTDYSEQRYAVVVPANTSNRSYWIKISIADKAKSASFTGDFNWLLNGCDPQSEEYLTLTSTEFQAVEGQTGAYSVKLNGDGYLPGGQVVFPSEVNGDVVTTIAASSLSDSEKTLIKSVQIPNSVTTIGDKAFENFTKLETFTIGETAGVSAQSATSNLKTIGKSAFYNCSSLINLELSNNLSVIDNRAFYSCASLNSITFPASLTNIGMEAFYNCTNLASATFDEESLITTIGYYAFRNCASLKLIKIPASITNLGNRAFYGCRTLETVTFADGINLSTIGENTFSGCVSLKSINIPEGVTIIGERAFYNCSSLQSLSVPATVISIEFKAFYNCLLTSIEFENIYGWQYYYEHTSEWIEISPKEFATTFKEHTNTNFRNVESVTYTLSSDQTYYIVDDSLNNIQNLLIKDFYNGKPVKEIKAGAFKNRNDIKTIHFEGESQLEIIRDSAFELCTSLSEINLPSSLKNIGAKAFYLTSLTYLVIPENVTNIGNQAFAATKLHTMVNKSALDIVLRSQNDNGITCLYSDMIFTSEVVWTEETNNTTGITYRIYRPKEGNNLTFNTLYKDGYSQEKFKVAIKVNDNTKSTYTLDSDTDGLGYHIFEDNLNLNYILLPESIKSMGSVSFGGCFKLAAVTNLSELNITNIAGSTQNFGCINYYIAEVYNEEVTVESYVNTTTNIEYLIVKKSGVQVDKIAMGIADGSISTSNVTLDEDTTIIGYAAFRNNANITQVVLNNGLKRIAYNAFRDCSALTTLNAIPDSVIDIGAKAFKGTALTTLTINTIGWKYSENATEWTNVTADNISSFIKANLDYYYTKG